jgi:hypothetical protein
MLERIAKVLPTPLGDSGPVRRIAAMIFEPEGAAGGSSCGTAA